MLLAVVVVVGEDRENGEIGEVAVGVGVDECDGDAFVICVGWEKMGEG